MARKWYDGAPAGADWEVKHEGAVASPHSTKPPARGAGVDWAQAGAPISKLQRRVGPGRRERHVDRTRPLKMRRLFVDAQAR